MPDNSGDSAPVRVLKFWYTSDREGLTFRCAGCDMNHTVTVSGPGAWQWNGDIQRPVLSPSVLVTMPRGDETHICHSFVGCNGAQPGEIIYLGDCTHALAGTAQPLPEWETTSP